VFGFDFQQSKNIWLEQHGSN